MMRSARLVQFVSAGIDFVKLDEIPDGVPVAANGGAYAEPMAEHALAMTLAAAKRLLISTPPWHAASSISTRGTGAWTVRSAAFSGSAASAWRPPD